METWQWILAALALLSALGTFYLLRSRTAKPMTSPTPTPPSPLSPEDEPRTLIFVDLLGFAALTLANPTRTVEWGPDEHGFTGSGTSPLQEHIQAFQRVIDVAVREASFFNGMSAMVFSDCAYLDAGYPFRAIEAATELMRQCIESKLAVRIGIGTGTFYGFKFSTESDGKNLVTKSLFAGTAVVNAYYAERSGAKGCRILVHPSAEPVLRSLDTRVKILPLAPPLPNATAELSYLPIEPRKHQYDPRWNTEREVYQDLRILDLVDEMERASAPASDAVKLQYSETRTAIHRMRTAMGRHQTLEQVQEEDAAEIAEWEAIADATAGD